MLAYPGLLFPAYIKLFAVNALVSKTGALVLGINPPSIYKLAECLAVPCLTRIAKETDWPVETAESNVVVLLPRRLNVRFAVEFDVAKKCTVEFNTSILTLQIGRAHV